MGPAVRFQVNFFSGQATSDGETGGGLPPREAAYNVASTDFWQKLDPFTTPSSGMTTVDPGGLAKGNASGGPVSLRARSRPAGDYVVYVYNWAGPDSSAVVKAIFNPPPAGDRSTSRYTDAEYAAYVKKVRDFVSSGGNLVLTDGALQMLPDLFPDKIKRSDVSLQTSYVGQVAFTKTATTSKDPNTP